MNMSSNVLPSIRYSTTGASPQLSLDVQPARSRFKIRPKSQYEQKLINAALLHTNSRIVIGQADQQSFTIGGVKVLSEKLSQLSTSRNADGTKDHSQSIDLSYPPSHPNTMQAYRLANNSAKNADKRNKGANVHNNKAQNKLTVTGNSSTAAEQANKGKSFMHNLRNNCKVNKSTSKLKLRKSSSRRRLSVDNGNSSKPDFNTSNAKAMKIYLSQKQSADISSEVAIGGVSSSHPSAPPCTPSIEMLKKFEYVPSLSDNLAKQQVKAKLKIMKKVETDKEKVKQADRHKIELKEAKEKEQELRKQQRRAIYALNAIMTKVENNQFERFKSEQGLSAKEYPSAKRK